MVGGMTLDAWQSDTHDKMTHMTKWHTWQSDTQPALSTVYNWPSDPGCYTPFSTSPISLAVSVDVKHHVYLLAGTALIKSYYRRRRPLDMSLHAKPNVFVEISRYIYIIESATKWIYFAVNEQQSIQLEKLRSNVSAAVLRTFCRSCIEWVLTLSSLCRSGGLTVKCRNVLNKVVNVWQGREWKTRTFKSVVWRSCGTEIQGDCGWQRPCSC